MTEAAISLQNVSKRFRLPASRRQSLKERAVRGRSADTHFWALREATFDIPRGSTFGIIGPNGSGKSTALKVMAGIYRPTSGRVLVGGSMSALLELGAGFHPELSGRENITLNASLLGLTPGQIEAATDEIIDFADLGDHIDAPVKVYSSGMYVRLGFAIAVAVRPEILIVDEVIAVGDEQFQRKCFEHLYGLRRSGATVVLVSHGLELVESMCDEAVWLERGRVRAVGGARKVVRRYIESVNQVTAEVDPHTGLEHSGSGEARITAVAFRGADGGPVLTGEPMEAVIRFECWEHLDEVMVGMSLTHDPGVRVTGPNNSRTGLFDLRPGPGEATFRTDRLILAPGRYEVAASLIQLGRRVVDYVPDAGELTVLPSGELSHGLVHMDGQWEMSQQAQPATTDS